MELVPLEVVGAAIVVTGNQPRVDKRASRFRRIM
jgi:hypothetical protein